MVESMICGGWTDGTSACRRLGWLLFQKLTAVKNEVASSHAKKKRDTAERDTEINRRAERILLDYGNAMLRLAYSYLHNKSDAEEIVQDALLKYLQHRPEFESEEHEKAWMMRVTVNLSKNKIAYNRIRMADELQEELVAEGREDLAFVWEAVKELPEQYREVVHLYYQEWYTTAQIAHILKRKESTVRSDLRRARQRLRQVLKEAYDFE